VRTLPALVRVIAAAALLLVAVPSSVAAASSVVECGQLTGYTAPDPGTPADGSLQLGLADTWVILASATISPAAASVLPVSVGSAPTCLAMDLDDAGVVTALDFAPSGELRGMVTLDTGSGFYMLADRLIIPDFITDANPALAALFVTSYQAGTELAITFTVDQSTGQLIGFDGLAAFCGVGSVTQDGDGQVGNAVIAAAVLDSEDLEALAGAGDAETCATIHSVGTIDPGSGAITASTDVQIDVAGAEATPTTPATPRPQVTPPATSMIDARDPSDPTDVLAGVALTLIIATLAAGVGILGHRSRPQGR
jgi:hypothetical protein